MTQENESSAARVELLPSSDLFLKVIPNASSNRVIGWCGNVLKVKLQAPPKDGRANRALVKLLAEHFEVPKRSIVIFSGEKSREKRIRIEGLKIDPKKKY
ncbi:MAG: DUF167 domain-containing protein [Puniceicoccales bacterium]|jgi:uncharacterized protein (TIGR00251 family)|nr:DUF167 domain-containing protein [Puniceicoccales bacterium]